MTHNHHLCAALDVPAPVNRVVTVRLWWVVAGQVVDAYHSTLGYSALHAAVDAGRVKVVKLLVSLGASVHLPRKVCAVGAAA